MNFAIPPMNGCCVGNSSGWGQASSRHEPRSTCRADSFVRLASRLGSSLLRPMISLLNLLFTLALGLVNIFQLRNHYEYICFYSPNRRRLHTRTALSSCADSLHKHTVNAAPIGSLKICNLRDAAMSQDTHLFSVRRPREVRPKNLL